MALTPEQNTQIRTAYLALQNKVVITDYSNQSQVTAFVQQMNGISQQVANVDIFEVRTVPAKYYPKPLN